MQVNLRLILRLLMFALVLAAIGWAATKVDWRLIREQLANASLPYVAGMLAAWILSLFIRPLRLWLLFCVAVPETNPRYWPAFRADNIAMAINSIVPARAGELAMAFVLRQSLGISTASSGSLVLVDRFLDFCTVVLIFVLSFLMSPGGVAWARDTTAWLLVVLAAFICGLILLVRLRNFWLSLVEQVLNRIAPASAKKWHGRIRDLFAILAVIDNVRAMISLTGLSVATWAVISLSYWFGLLSVWPDISPAAAAFTASAVALSFLLPISLAGIGLFQGAAVLALRLFGVPASVALAFGIMAHALQVLSILILAALSMVWQGMGLRTLFSMRRDERLRQPG